MWHSRDLCQPLGTQAKDLARIARLLFKTKNDAPEALKNTIKQIMPDTTGTLYDDENIKVQIACETHMRRAFPVV
jgi:hypothetical protein